MWKEKRLIVMNTTRNDYKYCLIKPSIYVQINYLQYHKKIIKKLQGLPQHLAHFLKILAVGLRESLWNYFDGPHAHSASEFPDANLLCMCIGSCIHMFCPLVTPQQLTWLILITAQASLCILNSHTDWHYKKISCSVNFYYSYPVLITLANKEQIT